MYSLSMITIWASPFQQVVVENMVLEVTAVLDST